MVLGLLLLTSFHGFAAGTGEVRYREITELNHPHDIFDLTTSSVTSWNQPSGVSKYIPSGWYLGGVVHSEYKNANYVFIASTATGEVRYREITESSYPHDIFTTTTSSISNWNQPNGVSKYIPSGWYLGGVVHSSYKQANYVFIANSSTGEVRYREITESSYPHNIFDLTTSSVTSWNQPSGVSKYIPSGWYLGGVAHSEYKNINYAFIVNSSTGEVRYQMVIESDYPHDIFTTTSSSVTSWNQPNGVSKYIPSGWYLGDLVHSEYKNANYVFIANGAKVNSSPSLILSTTSNQTVTPTGTVTLSGTTSDADGDVLGISATIGGVTKTAAVTPPGTWTLQWSGEIPVGVYSNIPISVSDGNGGSSSVIYTGAITVNNPPNAPTITSYSDNQSINDTTPTFTWTHSDPDGEPQSQYQVVGSKDGWATYAYNSGILSGTASSLTTTTLSEGTWSFAIRTADPSGSWSPWSYRSNMKIDVTAPTAPTITGNSNWSSVNEPVILGSASDTLSGINRLEYSLDGTTWTTYMSPYTLTVSSEGQTTVRARAIDRAGNTSVISTFLVKIDKTAPTTPSVGLSTTSWSTSDVVATLGGATDAGSGIQKYEYMLSGATSQAWTTYTSGQTVTISADGSTTISVRAIDNLNHVSSVGTAIARVDKTLPSPPSISTSPATSWSAVPVTVTVSNGTDSGSGVQKSQYKIGAGGVWTDYSSPFVISTTGTTYVYARTIDNLGQMSTEASTTVNINPNPPAISLDQPLDGTEYDDGEILFMEGTTSDPSMTDILVVRYTLYRPDGVPVPVHNNRFLKSYQSTGTSSYFGKSIVINATELSNIGGDYVLEVSVEDGNGGVYTDSVTIRINLNNVPTIVALTSPTAGSVYSAVVGFDIMTITGTVQDLDVGDTVTVHYRFDGVAGSAGTQIGSAITANGTPQGFTLTANVGGLSEGTHTLYVWAEDNNLGRTNPEVAVSFEIDKTAPVSPTILETYHGTWSEIELVSSPDTVTTEYKRTPADATFLVYSTPFTVSGATNIEVRARAVDAVGNVSADAISNIVLDLTGPDVTPNPLEREQIINQSLTVNVDVTDALSRLSKIYYQFSKFSFPSKPDSLLDPEFWTPIPVPANTSTVDFVVSLPSKGIWYLHVYAEDEFGNATSPIRSFGKYDYLDVTEITLTDVENAFSDPLPPVKFEYGSTYLSSLIKYDGDVPRIYLDVVDVGKVVDAINAVELYLDSPTPANRTNGITIVTLLEDGQLKTELLALLNGGPLTLTFTGVPYMIERSMQTVTVFLNIASDKLTNGDIPEVNVKPIDDYVNIGAWW